MIPLPPGCRVAHSIFFEISKLTDDIVDWFITIGGEIERKNYWDHRGRQQTDKFVRYGKGKLCYRRQDGSGGVRIHFHGDDASAASMFLIKFMDLIEQHNLQEYMELMNEQTVY